MQLHPIEIDIEVHRFLESRRTAFAQTHNDILRSLAGLPVLVAQSNGTTPDVTGGWSWKGVTLPNGTKLRMNYNGQTHTGEIRQGAWHVGGAIYRTPSAAAGGVARSKSGAPVSLDGWEYWEVCPPENNEWIRINELREIADDSSLETWEEMMKKPASEYTDQSSLRTLMRNAKRLGRDDVWQQAFRRLCELEGLNQTDPLHRDFYATLRAYEELLTEKNGRTTRASRTRQKLRNKGVVQCLEDWATSTAPTEGFDLLIKSRMPELTGESLVIKYADRFSKEAVAAAKTRLQHVAVG